MILLNSEFYLSSILMKKELLVGRRGDGGRDSERVRGRALRRQEAVRHAARGDHDHGPLLG